MNRKNIFLTGATSSVGPYVRAELHNRGLLTTALVRNATTIMPDCRTVVGDLSRIELLQAEIAAADGIIHLACPRSFLVSSVLAEDISATSFLISQWRAGAFIYASSPTVMQGVKRGILNETAPTHLDSMYDLGKLVNEFQLRLTGEPRRRELRTGAVSLRPALFFTAGAGRNNQQVLSAFYAQCMRGGKFLFDSEEGLANYGSSYIGGADFGRAAVDALGTNVSRPYNVAGGFCTWRMLIDTINRCAGTQGHVVVRAGAMPEPDEFRVWQTRTELDARAFGAQTGFVPRQSLEELVEDYVAAERGSVGSNAGLRAVN